MQSLELDRRLQRLEALLGARSGTEVTPAGGLLETASRLSERVALLHPPHLDQVESRLATLQTKLTNITERPEAAVIADADVQNKVRTTTSCHVLHHVDLYHKCIRLSIV